VVKIQILMSPGCGHGKRTSELVANVVREYAPQADVETILVARPDDAARLGFPGSPTVLVNGVDIEPQAPTNIGLG
jgi:hypothetical protein